MRRFVALSIGLRLTKTLAHPSPSILPMILITKTPILLHQLEIPTRTRRLGPDNSMAQTSVVIHLRCLRMLVL